MTIAHRLIAVTGLVWLLLSCSSPSQGERAASTAGVGAGAGAGTTARRDASDAASAVDGADAASASNATAVAMTGAAGYGVPEAAPASVAPRDLGAPGAAVARGVPPRNLVRLQPAVVVDATGFERPVAASTLFIPWGWSTQGGVFWGREALCTNGYQLNWAAASPDGHVMIRLLPQDRWESNNYGAAASTPGCRLAPITSVRQYLEGLVRQVQPGARILGFQPRNDLMQQFAQLNNRQPMPMGELRTWVEAAQVQFVFDDRGVPTRGLIALVAVFNLMRTNMGNGTMDALTASTFPGWYVQAPEGYLNEPFFEGLRRSVRTDPEWERRINGHNTRIAQVAIEESRKRAAMIAQSNAEIARIRQEAWASSQESADRRARQFAEVLRGVQSYDDANAPGGRVELSNLYGNAWRMNDGSYVLTNDASFEPWRDLQLAGQRLDATR
jgi:hypothetical protein